MAGETAEERTESLRSVVESGYVPAARVAGRPEGWGPGRTTARPQSGELQLRLDFDAVTGSAAGDGATDGSGGDRRSGPFEPADDLPTALAQAIVDPGRIEVRGPDRIADLEPWLAAQPAVGVALLQDDPRPRRGTPLALAVAGTDGRVVAADGAEAADALRRLLERLRHAARRARGQAAPRRGASPTTRRQAPPPVAFDTQIAAYILNAALRSQTIADVVAENLDQILPPATDLPATARAGLEALSALAVREPLERRLAEVKLDRLFRDIELPLIPVLARMEAVGVALDLEALAVLDREFAAEIDRLEQEIYVDVGHEFNLGSPKQLEQILFFELNLPKGKRTKTGYSTDASVLEELRPAHPMIDKLLEWRVYTKLRSTYVEALPTLIAADGRLHTTFHQAVASTGRLSSSDPNLQNIPIRTALGRKIRRAFVAGEPDLVLLAADYSQIELRILAHVSGDEHLKDAFARQADIHRETAARVLHKAPEEITHGERSMAKMVNFGLAYGMSDFGLASRANIPRKEAQEFINSYFAAYSGISYYMMAIKEQAKAQGFVETLLGRKRQIPELRASNPALRGAGERMAINMPIQGTAADIQKIAMIRVAERLAADGLARAPAAQRPRRAAVRGPARRGRAARRPRARDDGGRAAAVGAARRRRQGRRRLGVDDPAHARRRDRRRGRRAAARGADRAARSARSSRPCPSFPRSRRSRATCGRAWSARRSSGRACSWARTLRTHDPLAFAEAVAGRDGRGGRPARRSSSSIELSGDAALTIHLKMTGQLFVVPADAPEDPYVRLVLELADGRELRFRDIRKFGRIGLYGRDPLTGELVAEVGGAAVFAAIGPEPLADAFTLREFRRRLRRRKGRLKPLLLDQSFVAGVGNIYADEALWRSRLHPLRTAATLRPPDERRLYEAIRAVLAEAVERRGSSIDDYTAPDGDGSMQERLDVYQRTGEPCRRCGRPSGASSSARARPTSARGASACRPRTGRPRARSCAR